MIHLEDFLIKDEDSKRSRKLYRMSCDICSVDRGYQRKRRHGLGLCKSCANQRIHSGKVVSAKTKFKMSKSSWLKGGKGHHPLQDKKHTEQTKAKISFKTALQNKNYIKKYTYLGASGTYNMKSSWELKYALYLDSIGAQWIYEPLFKLSNGYAYLPDFQLINGDIIEIKGYMRADAQVKWDIFCSEYPHIKKTLLRKDDLKKMKII